ncbi:MAG: type II toxin-antitoxin system PemK/MazF family toxin [Acetobacteraceae bacterium]
MARRGIGYKAGSIYPIRHCRRSRAAKGARRCRSSASRYVLIFGLVGRRFRRAAPLYRLSLPAGEAPGLREPSQVMVDKIVAVRRDRCGAPIGRVDDATLLALGRLLAFVVGIAD